MKEIAFFNVMEEEILESTYYDEMLSKEWFSEFEQVSTYEVCNMCWNSDFFKSKIQNIKKEYIYDSEMHGVFHNVRVAMLSYYIACKLGLDVREQELLIDASMYHDIGRVNDIDDILHGDRSASKVVNIILDKDLEYMKLLKVVIICHSHEDFEMDSIIMDSELEYDLPKMLACILKDTDALDRIRFDGLDPSYLRLDVSKKLLNASAGLFFTYQKFLENNSKTTSV